MSSSLSKAYALHMYGGEDPFELKLFIPKGSKAAVSINLAKATSFEFEILVRNSTKFRILGIDLEKRQIELLLLE